MEIKKIKEKVVVTEQPESWSEEVFDSKEEPVMLKECKMVVEDLLCDTQETNGIHNEDQNYINKDDEFIAKTLKKLAKWKKIYLMNYLMYDTLK